MLLAIAGAGPAAAAPQTPGCLIEPDRVADVGSPVVGVIERYLVERGDTVSAGQPVAELRSRVEQANVQVARTRANVDADVRAAAAGLTLARQKLDRQADLARHEFVSTQALDQARSELDVAQQRLAQARSQLQIWRDEQRLAEAQLEQRTIRSPLTGVVVERYLNAGERVEERPLLRVAAVDPLRVELMAPLAQFGLLSAGQSLTIRPELPRAGPVTARIVRVDDVVDAASNTFRVQLRLPNPGRRLPAGLRCKADLPGAPPALPAAGASGAGRPGGGRSGGTM